ncbi:MAG: AraC family transcriptional regulator [Rhodanobacter sp.]
MMQGTYGERLGRSFHVVNPPTLVSRTPRGQSLAVTEIFFDKPHHGLTEPFIHEDAYLIGLQLRSVKRLELWLKGRPVAAGSCDSGATFFIDLMQKPVLFYEEPFHHLAFLIPRQSLEELSQEMGSTKINSLLVEPGQYVDDATIRNLGESLIPYLKLGAQSSQIFVDYLLLALNSHLISTYGGARLEPSYKVTGLAPWQQRRAKELMREHLSVGISLIKVASACRLSPSAFVKAFKKSVGITPHQWLLHQRIDYATELMRRSDLSLVEVALSSGFADQSHFTRTFTQKMGESPGAFRRFRQAAVA